MRNWTILVAGLVVVAVLSAVALGAGSKPSPEVDLSTAAAGKTGKFIKACAKKRGGALRIAKRCRKNERRSSWQDGREGSAGARGPTGANGAIGPAGPAGATGAAGVDGAAGATGATGIQAPTERMESDGTSTGETFFAQVSGSQTNFGGSGTNCTTTPSGPTVNFTAPDRCLHPDHGRGGAPESRRQPRLRLSEGGRRRGVQHHEHHFPGFREESSSTRAFCRSHGQVRGRPLPLSGGAGAHTVSLQYGSDGGQSAFRNRKLWVTMFQPTQ